MARKMIHKKYSYRQFIDHAVNRVPGKNAYNNSRDSTRRFYGVSWDEAIDLALHGWDSGIKQLKELEAEAVPGGVEFEPNVVGAVVNMGAYLTGDPLNMYSFRDATVYQRPKLALYINSGASSSVSADNIFCFAKGMTTIINHLQQYYNLKIVVISGSRAISRYRDLFTEVALKDYDERLVLNNIAFAFHPSFLRRLTFSHIEEIDNHRSAYGYPWFRSHIMDQVSVRPDESALFMPDIDGIDKPSTAADILRGRPKGRPAENFNSELLKSRLRELL